LTQKNRGENNSVFTLNGFDDQERKPVERELFLDRGSKAESDKIGNSK